MKLLHTIHDIIEEGDNDTTHDIVEVMFNLLDANQLNQLEDIIVNQYPNDDDYDPTPYYLYDNTNGEPPISWKERQDAEQKRCEEQF